MKALNTEEHRALPLSRPLISERSTSSRLRKTTDLTSLISLVNRDSRSFTARSVNRLATQWSRPFKGRQDAHIDEGTLLAWAFPDRVARRRDNRGVYLLKSGQGAVIDTTEPLANEEWLVAAELHDQGANTRIRLAAAISEEQVRELFETQFKTADITVWDKKSESVNAVRRTSFGAITIKELPCRDADEEAVAQALMEGVQQKGVNQLPWSKKAQALRERVSFVARSLPDQGWPLMTDEALTETLKRMASPRLQWHHPLVRPAEAGYASGGRQLPHPARMRHSQVGQACSDTYRGAERFADTAQLRCRTALSAGTYPGGVRIDANTEDR